MFAVFQNYFGFNLVSDLSGYSACKSLIKIFNDRKEYNHILNQTMVHFERIKPLYPFLTKEMIFKVFLFIQKKLRDSDFKGESTHAKIIESTVLRIQANGIKNKEKLIDRLAENLTVLEVNYFIKDECLTRMHQRNTTQDVWIVIKKLPPAILTYFVAFYIFRSWPLSAQCVRSAITASK